jgi:outer membrane protein
LISAVRIIAGLCIGIVLCGGQVWAAGDGIKVAVVDATALMEKAPQADQASKRLKQEFQTRENALISKQKDIKRMEEKVARDGAIMSESERRKIERDLLADKRDLKRAQDEFRDDLNFRRNEELGKLQKLINQAIEAIGKEGGYDVILYDGIAYASPRVNVTDQVLKRLQR